MSPDDIVEEVKKSGLRGRGGAGFPTGMKWSFIAKPEGVPRHFLCNADESEPGTFKDRYLMEKIPHLLIEGMIISSYALGANTSYIYIRGEYSWIPDILEEAIAEAKKAGFLGKNILGTGYDLEIYVHRGAGAGADRGERRAWRVDRGGHVAGPPAAAIGRDSGRSARCRSAASWWPRHPAKSISRPCWALHKNKTRPSSLPTPGTLLQAQN